MKQITTVVFSMVLAACMPIRKHEESAKSTVKDTTETDVTVLFHPVDPSLEMIAKEILKAQSNIDIAMYSMDVSMDSPVIQAIASDAIQSKLKAGTLKIRVIFEGYGGDEDNKTRSTALENLGVDVRWFSSGRKVHHKFSVIDSDAFNSTLITGSANWSLGSMKNYDEAILIFRQHPGITMVFQKEFNLLWSLSKEFGATKFPKTIEEHDAAIEPGLSAWFNTANFKVNGSRLTTIEPKLWTLTRTIVKAIDSAETSIKIASTRIVLRPVYNALLRAAARGVKIDILVNQDEYDLPSIRKNKTLTDCANEYLEKCSTEIAFPWFLDSRSYPGKENVKVFVKFFSLNTRVTLSKQMHSKYIIIDDKQLASGSFNWSTSAEYNHIENIVGVDQEHYGPVIAAFIDNHAKIFDRGRDQYQPYITRIEGALRSGTKTDCSFDPMTLTFSEIDYLLDTGKRTANKPFKDACR